MIDLLAFLQQLVVRLEMEDPEAETLISQLELVPPSESVNFKTDLKNAGPRRAAKIFPPNHNPGRGWNSPHCRDLPAQPQPRGR